MAEKIDILGDAEKLRAYWGARDVQMRLDRSIINLEKPIRTTKDIKWISNDPKVFYDTATALISSYPPRFRCPLDVNFTPEQEDKISKAERLAVGIFRNLDMRQTARGQNYWLRELAWWMLSGWYSIFSIVKRKGKGVEFIADLWDPINVYPEWDSDGLVKCVRTYEVDKMTAMSMASSFEQRGLERFNVPIGDGTIKVTNYWRLDRNKTNLVRNAIFMGTQAIKPLTKEPFEEIPVLVGGVGSPEKTSDDWVTRRGENIIAANRDMYEYTNTMISLMATIMAETAYPNMVTKTQSGAPAVKGKMQGYGQTHSLKLGETIELLKHASTPTEVNLLLSYVNVRKQEGSVPESVYGHIPFELSGFAISQLMAAIKYKMGPYLTTMQYVMGQLASNFLTQYEKGDGKPFPKITLSVPNPKQLRKELFFIEDFSPEDVPENKYVQVTIPVTSSVDKTQQLLFARQALQEPRILSRKTIWDDILEIQDSEQEYARIIQDEMLDMPVVKNIALLEQLRMRKDKYLSEGKAAEANAINSYIMMMEMELGMRQSIPVNPKSPGANPMMSPPEMNNNPDMQRAAQGVGPPGLNRRPQTPEERAASQGRKGVLVSPRGDTLL